MVLPRPAASSVVLPRQRFQCSYGSVIAAPHLDKTKVERILVRVRGLVVRLAQTRAWHVPAAKSDDLACSGSGLQIGPFLTADLLLARLAGEVEVTADGCI